ncbi:MAG TPA: copper resistance CopC family protein [Candidatus Binataceae bacterium]|nr:copper resistance CopC family protein [Candidatus Binataceae bacterium]
MKKLCGLIMGLMLSAAPAAWAHSFPQRQSPAAGETLTSPPSEVSIKYDAPIEKLFAKLEVVGPDGKNEATSAPQVSADGRTLSVKLVPLKPGEYEVKWGVVGIDTHRTQGSYTFTVAVKGG